VTAELNTDFYPILLSRFEEPLAAGQTDAYFRKLIALADAAIVKGERYVVVITSDAMKFGAAGRRQVAEAETRYLTPARNEVTLAAFVPIDNAFVRGGLTALRWIAPETVKAIRTVASLEVALDQALRVLEENGTPFKGELVALRRALGLSGVKM
jgi:hypothetical protein